MNVLEMTKKAAIAEMKMNLRTKPEWALKGLKTIYESQTESEKSIGATVEHNGVGFTGVDSILLSSFAEQVLSGRVLSQRQMVVLLKCMPKYAGQLYKIAKAKAVVKESEKQKEIQRNMEKQLSQARPPETQQSLAERTANYREASQSSVLSKKPEQQNLL